MNTDDDPIVAEIRAIRRELATRFGDDINALCDFRVEVEHEHEGRLVNYPPKPPNVTDADDASGRRSKASSTFPLPVINVPMARCQRYDDLSTTLRCPFHNDVMVLH